MSSRSSSPAPPIPLNSSSSSSISSNSLPLPSNIGIDVASNTKRKSKGRTFRCVGYPDCNMTFTRSEHLARHIRKHTGERPFECVHCSRKFSRLDNLRQHKQTVHSHERIIVNYVDSQIYSQNNQIQALSLPQDIQQSQLISEDHTQKLQRSPLQNASSDGAIPALKEHYSNQQFTAQQQQPQQPQEQNNGSKELLEPSKFRPKHRPGPLALPTRGSIYNDVPYVVPGQRLSASTPQFALSPMSPSYKHHQYELGSSMISNNSNSSNLPSFQFLTGINQSGSLISPYNSSFGSSTTYSSTRTPMTSSFDLKTPTSNTTFESIRNNGNFSGGSTNSYLSSVEQSRKSWNSNILNPIEASGAHHVEASNPRTNNPFAQSSPGQYKVNLVNHSLNPIEDGSKLKIEALLNSNKNGKRQNIIGQDGESIQHDENTNDDEAHDLNDKVRLPPVDKLGLQKQK